MLFGVTNFLYFIKILSGSHNYKYIKEPVNIHVMLERQDKSLKRSKLEVNTMKGFLTDVISASI